MAFIDVRRGVYILHHTFFTVFHYIFEKLISEEEFGSVSTIAINSSSYLFGDMIYSKTIQIRPYL